MIVVAREALYRSLRAVAPFAFVSHPELADERPQLEGVFFDAGLDAHGRPDLVLVATDGHTLACAQPITGYSSRATRASVLLPSKTAAALIAALKPTKATAGHEMELVFAPDGALVVKGWTTDEGQGSAKVAAVRNVPLEPARDAAGKACAFPPWRAVTPPREPVEPDKSGKRRAPEYLCAAAQYIERAGVAARHFGRESGASRGMVLRVPADDLDAIRIDVEARDTGTLTMVIMPMRR